MTDKDRLLSFERMRALADRCELAFSISYNPDEKKWHVRVQRKFSAHEAFARSGDDLADLLTRLYEHLATV
jgi:hypothetical protein